MEEGVAQEVCLGVSLRGTLGVRGPLSPHPKLILDLGTSWYRVVTLTHRPPSTLDTHWVDGCVSPRACLDREDRGKIICLCIILNSSS